MFRAHDAPTDIPEVVIPAAEMRDGRIRVARLAALAFPKAVPSNKEGRRKIEQGGVRLDGVVVEDPDLRSSSQTSSTAARSSWAAATGPA